MYLNHYILEYKNDILTVCRICKIMLTQTWNNTGCLIQWVKNVTNVQRSLPLLGEGITAEFVVRYFVLIVATNRFLEKFLVVQVSVQLES